MSQTVPSPVAEASTVPRSETRVVTAVPGEDAHGGNTAPAAPAVDRLLAAARRGLDRVHPADLAQEMTDGALVVDIRPVEQRARDGELPGALVIDRNVLEWRLDPTSPHSVPEAHGRRRVVLVCNEGYSSSLAARTLRDLGVRGATDLVGGFQRWKYGGDAGS